MIGDTHTLSGAYALDALEPSEVESFEQHLAECASCRQEVAEFRAVTAELATLESTTPPAALREQVLASAARTRQLPPVVRSLSRGPARPARWLAAAAAAVLVAVGGAVAVSQSQDQGTHLASTVHQVFDAQDAHVREFDTANGGTLRVATSQSLHEMAIDTADLPRLSEQQVYQLWTMHDGTARSAGLLGDTGTAMGLPDHAKVAITIEAAGGATQPTRTPIVTVNPRSI